MAASACVFSIFKAVHSWYPIHRSIPSLWIYESQYEILILEFSSIQELSSNTIWPVFAPLIADRRSCSSLNGQILVLPRRPKLAQTLPYWNWCDKFVRRQQIIININSQKVIHCLDQIIANSSTRLTRDNNKIHKMYNFRMIDMLFELLYQKYRNGEIQLR